MDEVADLSLALGAEYVDREERHLALREFILTEEPAHLGTVPVGEDQIVAARGDAGERWRGPAHLLDRLAPAAVAAGLGQRVPPEGHEDPHGSQPPRPCIILGAERTRAWGRTLVGERPIAYIPAVNSPSVAELDPGPVCALEFRYGRDEVRALFTREARLQRALQIEAALAESEAEAGTIPREAATAIAAAASGGTVTVSRVDELERELKHDVMAITRALAEKSGVGSGWVHFGATSNDITDTALALELKESAAILRDDLTGLSTALLTLARKHRATPEDRPGPTGSLRSRSASATRWPWPRPRSPATAGASINCSPGSPSGRCRGRSARGRGSVRTPRRSSPV